MSLPPASPVTSPASVTVVVPTYQEVQNIPHLIERLRLVREQSGIDLELILMDDDSRDGSDELVRQMAMPWARLVTRTTNRSLSCAVLDGLRLSQRDVLVVMDADLSHPPEKIPEIVESLLRGADVVVGSRFADGGSTADDWGILRWFNSRLATIMALPLTNLSDPMSGFFAIRRATFEGGRDFNPVGYKILLELIIKCRCRSVMEVPIHFDNRRFGESKLSLEEQLKYIRHLRRLYIYKYGTWSHLIQFVMVGFSGLIVNLGALTLLLHLGLVETAAVALAIVVSMMWNFALNRRFSFSYARDESMVRQFFGFVAACSVGAVVNYVATTALWPAFQYKQVAAVIGVLLGTAFNFTASRFIVFRSKHIRP
jgi:dolichol-phosphate mannosyltransferase